MVSNCNPYPCSLSNNVLKISNKPINAKNKTYRFDFNDLPGGAKAHKIEKSNDKFLVTKRIYSSYQDTVGIERSFFVSDLKNSVL